MSDKEFLGKSQMQIESYDSKCGSQAPLLDFRVYEYLGIEVSKFPGYGATVTAKDLLPIKDKNGLKVGDQIMVPSPFEGGYWVGTVYAWEDGSLYGSFSNGQLIGSLDFGTDSRGCWVCTSFGHTAGLARITFA